MLSLFRFCTICQIEEAQERVFCARMNEDQLQRPRRAEEFKGVFKFLDKNNDGKSLLLNSLAYVMRDVVMT